MQSFIFLFRLKAKLVFRMVFDSRPEKILNIVVAIIVLFCFTGSSFWFFRTIFSYLSKMPDFGLLLMDRILSLGLLAFSLMLVISNLITSIATFYRSRETSFLNTLPVSTKAIFIVKFVDNLFYSSWGVLLLGIPLAIAYGVVRKFTITNYLYTLFFILPVFILIPAFIGSGLSLLIAQLTRRFRLRTIVLASTGGLLLFVMLFVKLSAPSTFMINVAYDYRALGYYVERLSTVSFPFSPNFWFLESMRSFAEGTFSLSLIYSLALVSTALMLGRFCLRLADKLYYPSWLIMAELTRKSKVKRVQRNYKKRSFSLKNLFPTDIWAISAKDAKLFFRDANQWAQFSILLTLLLLYLVNLRRFSIQTEEQVWHTIIAFLNFGFSGYILATLCVRFVFPSISLEGKSFWAIGSSPLSTVNFFWEKFWWAFIVFFILAEFQAVISCTMLRLSGFMMFLTLGGILIMSITLTSLSVGMGAIYPRFHESNPGKIASSVGGMLTIILSLIYVGSMVIILAWPAHGYALYLLRGRPFPEKAILISSMLVILLNLFTIYLPIKIGTTALKRHEF